MTCISCESTRNSGDTSTLTLRTRASLEYAFSRDPRRESEATESYRTCPDIYTRAYSGYSSIRATISPADALEAPHDRPRGKQSRIPVSESDLAEDDPHDRDIKMIFEWNH